MRQVINTEKIPIKLWLDYLEDGAEQQAKNLANLPFAFKHIAIMPDSHQGFGMPIGGVLATENNIIPNAVGVDIGCFTGDTKVILVDGRNLTFKELIDEDIKGKINYCYSLDKNNNIIIEKIIKPRETRKTNELLEIELDNGEKIKCTLDHIFYLRNGSQKKAIELTIEDSLMPLYIGKAKDISYNDLSYQNKRNKLGEYLVVYNPLSNKFDFIHFLADDYNRKNLIYDKKGIRHHKDFNKYNNSPENISIVFWKEHWLIHGEYLKKLHQDPEFCKRRDARASETFKKYNKTLAFHRMTRKAGERGKKYLIERNKSESGRKKSSDIAHKSHICNICNIEVIGGFGVYNHQQEFHPQKIKCEKCNTIFKNRKALNTHKRYCKNHKIVNIRRLQVKNESVYCLTVNYTHNFALTSGIFVHNCGMCAVKTSLTEIDKETLKKIMGEIRKAVPVGFAHQRGKQLIDLMPNAIANSYPIVEKEFSNALTQIGTLGGGNHFIEIQKGNDGHVWIMIHSGSRNFGLKIADHYNKRAKELNKKWSSGVPPSWDLAFLPTDSEDGQDYINEMKYAVEFALANRKLMMVRVMDIVSDACFENKIANSFSLEQDMINIAHNYAKLENHFGKNVWVHRKGATLATESTIGIIPGSQGTKSYIVKGKGNEESFQSCSHGAGRKMGRKQACRALNLEEEIKKLDDQGIIHGIRNVNDLDEAAGAYKDIVDVMKNQDDLVEILVELSPLAVIKG